MLYILSSPKNQATMHYLLNMKLPARFALFVLLYIAFSMGCEKEVPVDAEGVKISQDDSDVKTWKWDEVILPLYNWQEGVTFGGNLHVDVEYDFNGISIVDDELRFHMDPNFPIPAATTESRHNFRSEIRTAPWRIHHPLGTEQWIGWQYTFGSSYVIDPTSPITIFQNHPGIRGKTPIFEIEIAKASESNNTVGGEIQVVNKGGGDRIAYPITPKAGETLDVVIHVVYGLGSTGLLQVWLNGEMVYDRKVSTVFDGYEWGGNNKWGIYHHTFNGNPEAVQASLDIGAGKVELAMGTLRMLTRTPEHHEYQTNAYHFVKPD